MTLKQCLSLAFTELTLARIPSAQLDIELIASHVLQKERTWLITHDGYILSETELEKINSMVAKRAKRVPLAYLTGHKEFYGREFIVTPDVLTPRPETEDLIEIIKQIKPKRLLDAGSGSGCIGLTSKLELPDTCVTLSDIDELALEIAKQNGESLSVGGINYVESDLLEHWLHQDSLELYDLIGSNLPYVDRDWETSPELDYEPETALYATDYGLELIKKLIDQASQALTGSGYLLLEADPRQHDRITRYSNQFTEVRRHNFALLLQLNTSF